MRGRRGGAYSSTAGIKPSHRIENNSEWSSNTWNDGTPYDDEEPVCPLCIELLDETEIRFRPCPCGYRVCLFCYERIKRDLFGLCPSCRTPYGAPKSDSPTPGPSKPKPPPPYTKPQPAPSARAAAGPPPAPPHHAPAALPHVFPTPPSRFVGATKPAWTKGASPPRPPLARAPWGLPPALPGTSSKPAWTQNAVPPGNVAAASDRGAPAGATLPGKTWATNGALPAAAPGEPAASLTGVQSSWHHVPSTDQRKAVGPGSGSVEGWGSLGAGGVENSRVNFWEEVGGGGKEEVVVAKESGNLISDTNGTSFGFSNLWGPPSSASKPLVPTVGQGVWGRGREGGRAGVANGGGGLGLIGGNDEVADLVSSLRVRNGISVLQQQFFEISVSMGWSAEEMRRARERVEESRREQRGGKVEVGRMEKQIEAWGGAGSEGQGTKTQGGVAVLPSAGNRRGGDMAAFISGGSGSRPTSSSSAHSRPHHDYGPESEAISSNQWPTTAAFLPLSLSRPPTPGSSSHSQPSTPGEGGSLHGRGGLDAQTEFLSHTFSPSLPTSPASAVAGLAGGWGSIANSHSPPMTPGSIPPSPRLPRAMTISGPTQPTLTGGSLLGAGDGAATSSSPPTRPRSSGLSASAGVFVPQSLTFGRSQSQGATPASPPLPARQLRGDTVSTQSQTTSTLDPNLVPAPMRVHASAWVHSNPSLLSPRWSSLFSESSGASSSGAVGAIPIPTPIPHQHPVPAPYAYPASTPASSLPVSLGLGVTGPPSTSGASIWGPLESATDEGSLPSSSRFGGKVYRTSERDFRNLGPIGFRSGSRVAESGGGGGLGRTPAPYRPPLEGQVAQMPWGGGGVLVGASGEGRGSVGDSVDTNGFRNPLDALYGGRVDPPLDSTFGREYWWVRAPIGSSRGFGSCLQECSICRAFSTFSQADLEEHIELCQAAAMILD